MLGFISALSAAVATMTLLMAVLLANVLSSTMAAEKNKGKAAFVGIDDNNTETSSSINNGSHKGNDIMKSLIFSHDTIKFVDSKKVKSIDIYCSYGNNISFDIAMTYTIYNTVLIKKSTPNVHIKALKPIEDNQGVNACFLKSEENERK
ncbi:hypothetical protein ABN078_14130 [Providencia huaxiensis]|uniref:hypothetical protein n=1 Tax=Providencia TaxID=586 RepID=UPI00204C06DF|nr:hypothetical protein [Providencia sp. PROV032]ELR5075751.1 hypothetical protein [Providencia stuartii]UPS63371.1 hypothetical protein M0M83_02150 [Providencia rettgeri]HEC8326233.1 hypothetical protein [Providencia rettgeri]